MPKSFIANAFVRPFVAATFMMSAATPIVARAEGDESSYLEVASFETLAMMPEQARGEYIGRIRELLADLSEKDAGTEFEFFNGHDRNALTAVKGWRGGYFAILQAFAPPAIAQVEAPADPYPNGFDSIRKTDAVQSDYVKEREKILKDWTPKIQSTRAGDRYSSGVFGAGYTKTQWEAGKAKALQDLDEKYKKVLKPDEFKAAEKKAVEAQAAAATSEPGKAPAAGASAGCPTDYSGPAKSCFVAIDEKAFRGDDARIGACNTAGGVYAQTGNFFTSKKSCMTPEYFESLRAKDQAKLVGKGQDQFLAKKRCPAPPVNCSAGKASKKDLADIAKMKKDRCIYAGNLSSYPEGSENPANRKPGRCQPPKPAKFGDVTVACDEKDKKNVILCNPVFFDTAEIYVKGQTNVKGLCVPKSQTVTRDCQKAYDKKEAAAKKVNGPAAPKFWDHKLPGMLENYNAVARELNETCGDKRVRQFQCQECAIVQKNLALTNTLTKDCKEVPLPPARPSGMPGAIDRVTN